jgi:hypothetical protein
MTTLTSTTVRHDGSFVDAAWESWLGASTLACETTGAAWTWYVQSFFSQEAMRRYQWLGQMIACLTMLAYLAGKLTRLHLESSTQLYTTFVLPVSTVHEAESPTEKNESILTICTLQQKPYQELKALAKSLGHPKPHMTKKVDLIDWIQLHQA